MTSKNVLLVHKTEAEVNKIIGELKPNTCVVAECFSENNGTCYMHHDMIEEKLMNSFADIKFIRFGAGASLKGSIESLPVDTYPTYLFYTVTEVGGLKLVDRFVPRDFAKIDLDDDVYFGESLYVKPLVNKLHNWIKEKRDELKDEKIAREAVVAKEAVVARGADLSREEASGKRYGLRDRRTRKKSGDGSSR